MAREVDYPLAREVKMASNLTVLAFDDMETAEEVHQALVHAKNQGLIVIEDAAVVVKDEDGKVKVDNQVARGTWAASAVGGGLGLLIGSIFFPIGGLVLGLAGGALVAKSMDLGVDGKFVDEVGKKISPGTSALFVLSSGGNESAILAVLREYEGHVLQTTLDSETEEHIKKALKDES
jgi:uncharacterized membrane protein